MKKQLLVGLSAFVFTVAAISSPQLNSGKKTYVQVSSRNDTIPNNQRNNDKMTDSARDWRNGNEAVHDNSKGGDSSGMYPNQPEDSTNKRPPH